MQQEEALQRVRGRLSLVLDTTYCSPQYLFPPQLQVSPLTPSIMQNSATVLSQLWELMSHRTAFIAMLCNRSAWDSQLPLRARSVGT